METKWEITIEQAESGSWVWEVTNSAQPSWLTQVGISESVDGAIADVSEIIIVMEMG